MRNLLFAVLGISAMTVGVLGSAAGIYHTLRRYAGIGLVAPSSNRALLFRYLAAYVSLALGAIAIGVYLLSPPGSVSPSLVILSVAFLGSYWIFTEKARGLVRADRRRR